MTIAFVYCIAGTGHLVPARAMAEAADELYGVGTAVLADFNKDIIKDERAAALTDKGWAFEAQFPWMTRLIHRTVNDGNWFGANFSQACQTASKRNCKLFREWAERIKPDIVVVTNWSMATFVAELKARTGATFKVVSYSCDVFMEYFGVRRFASKIDFSAVPSRQGVEYCLNNGFAKEKLLEIPYPVRKSIQNAPRLSKTLARNKVGINRDGLVVLVQGGGAGVFDWRFLRHLNRKGTKATLIVLGRLSKKSERVIAKYKDFATLNIVAPGFVDNVNDYVLASDIIMSRSGTNSALEGFCLGVPSMYCAIYSSGIEFARVMKQYGCGLVATTPRSQAATIARLADHPEEIAALSANISKLGLSFSAAEAVKRIVAKCSI